MACPKYAYDSEQLAVTALIDQHIYKGFARGEGPKTVYECHRCGAWHLTSRGEAHPQLEELYNSGQMQRQQQASAHEQRFGYRRH